MASSCAPLHSRSSYSLLRGTVPVERLVAAAAAAGYGALALTDRNNLYGAVAFAARARGAGLVPILGVELDEPGSGARGPLALVLARGSAGYRTLSRLATRRALEPDFALARALAAEHEDVHVLAADADFLAAVRDAVPPGRLWVEVESESPGAIERGGALARRLGLRAAASVRIARLEPEEVRVARLLAAARAGALVAAVGEEELEDTTPAVRPAATVERALAAAPELLAANRDIAADCRAELPDGRPIFPRTPLPPGETPYSCLLERALDGLRRRYGALAPGPMARLMRELEAIARLGFVEYFVVVGDVVAFARAEGIPVVGRGSGASSIVAYVLGITNVDPLAHRLHFERFLNELRGADLPDLDVDLDWRGRDAVIAHVYRTYGDDRVAMISTHNFFHPRSAFREAARAHGVPVAEVNRLARFLPHEAPDQGLAALAGAAPGLRELDWASEPWRSILAGAEGLLGLPRHLGIHPGGIVIGDRPLADLVPLERAAKGIVVTQYEMEAVAAIGLVKIDLLGNRGLSTVGEAARLASPPLDLDRALDRDPATARLLAAGDTLGCFQIESPGMRNLLGMLAPGSAGEVVDAVALIRPGPAGSGMKERFVRRARGIEAAAFAHPALAPVLGPTHGIPLYEEDVMGMAEAVAGMSLAEADQLRRAIGGARAPEEVRALRNGFVARAVRAGVEPDQAEGVWEEMARFASYSFSRAHAAGYGLIAYQSAYLKAHHAAAFACAVLNHHQGMYARWVHVEDARRHGVRLLLPSVNASEAEFTLEGAAVRTGLGEVMGLSAAAIAALLAARREGGRFASLGDFRRRVACAAPELAALIRAGAFDDLGRPRSELLWEAHAVRAGEPSAARELLTPAAGEGRLAPALRELRPLHRLRDEFAALGISPTAHPLFAHAPGWAARLDPAAARRLGLEGPRCSPPASGLPSGARWIPAARLAAHAGAEVAVAGLAAASRRTPTRAGETMAFVTLDDPSGMAECTLFPPVFRRYARERAGPGPLWAAGRAEEQYGVVTLNAERLGRLTAA